MPAVSVVGIVVDRGPDTNAILVTRFLDYSTTYRAVFSSPRGGQPTYRLLDALVELLVRLHLSGFFWGDCSLSNTLFRYDAGTLEAYLVNAETSERHPTLTAGQRRYDVELAEERVYGELLDLQAGELLSPELDPLKIPAELPRRYELLWDELTREELLRPDDQRYRIAQRLRRLNELGFDADEVELISTPDGNRLKLRTKVSESGHHRAQAVPAHRARRGEENQARRLLNDIASFRAYLEQKQGCPVSEMVAASQWLGDVYDPVVAAIPEGSAWPACHPPRSSTRSSSTAGTCRKRRASDVGTTTAAPRSYFQTVLPGGTRAAQRGRDGRAGRAGLTCWPDWRRVTSGTDTATRRSRNGRARGDGSRRRQCAAHHRPRRQPRRRPLPDLGRRGARRRGDGPLRRGHAARAVGLGAHLGRAGPGRGRPAGRRAPG